MLPSRGCRRILADVEWIGQPSPCIAQVSYGSMRTPRLGFGVGMNSNSDISQRRNYTSRTTSNPSRSFTTRTQTGLQLAQGIRPGLKRTNISAAQRFSPNPSQVRYQSTSQTGPFNTPLPPGDYGLDTTGFLSDAANEAQLGATGGSVGNWTAGYLKELGLDFGWGPTSSLQWLFEHLHMYDGLTIGGTIVTTAILIRMFTFPTVIAASNTTSRLGALATITEPLRERVKQAAMARDQMEMQKAKSELRKVYEGSNIKLWKSFLPMINIPIGFGFWRLTRNMADLPVPGMETGGFLWFNNLINPDPYFILPIATGLIQHISMRFGGETASTSEASKKMRAIFVYGLPLMAPIFIGFAPAAVQLSFCTAATLSLCTTTALRQPFIRNIFKLPPIISRAAATSTAGSAASAPYKGTITVSGRAKDQRPMSTSAAPPVSNKSSITSTLDKFRPTNIKRNMGEMRKTVNDFVGETVPGAQQKVQTKREKAARNKADDYEVKRRAEIERAREVYEAGLRRGGKK